MLAFSRRNIAFAAACGLLATLPVVAQAQPAVDDKALATALRAGGHVILVRHGATFPDQADTDPLHPENIAAQRQLNDSGKALAKAFGEALRQGSIPSARSTPATLIAPTRPRRLPASPTSRRPRT